VSVGGGLQESIGAKQWCPQKSGLYPPPFASAQPLLNQEGSHEARGARRP
jgi:hypothetical protein